MVDNAFTVDLMITLISLIAVFFVIDYLLIRLLRNMINLKKILNKYAIMQKTKIDQSFNKYISLTPKDLDERLISIFAYQLEVTSASDVSEADPNAGIVLYTKSVEKLLVYLGPRPR